MKYGLWFLRYASGQTDKKTDKQTNTLITILRNHTWGEVTHIKLQTIDKKNKMSVYRLPVEGALNCRNLKKNGSHTRSNVDTDP